MCAAAHSVVYRRGISTPRRRIFHNSWQQLWLMASRKKIFLGRMTLLLSHIFTSRLFWGIQKSLKLWFKSDQSYLCTGWESQNGPHLWGSISSIHKFQSTGQVLMFYLVISPPFILITRAQNVKPLETQTRKSALGLWTLSLKTWCKWVGLILSDDWDTNLTFRMWKGRHRWYPEALLKIFTPQHLTSEWREFVDAHSLFCNHQP